MTESISHSSEFKTILRLFSKLSSSTPLHSLDDGTYLSIYNHIVFIYAIIPEFKEEYQTAVNCSYLDKIIGNTGKDDTIKLSISNDIINVAVYHGESIRQYKYPAVVDYTDSRKELEKCKDIKAKNHFAIDIVDFMKEVDSLLFSVVDKSLQKIELSLTDDSLQISDCNKNLGDSTSIFALDKSQIKRTDDSRVKINFSQIKPLLDILKNFNKNIVCGIQNEYPFTIFTESNGYQIKIVLAPMVDNE